MHASKLTERWRRRFFIASSSILTDHLRLLLQSLSSHVALVWIVQFDLREQSRYVRQIVDDGRRKEFLLHFRRKVRSPEARPLSRVEVEIYCLGLFKAAVEIGLPLDGCVSL